MNALEIAYREREEVERKITHLMDASNALQVAGRYFHFHLHTSDAQITAQIAAALTGPNGAAPNYQATLHYELGRRSRNLQEIQQLRQQSAALTAQILQLAPH